jgi:hypothetical protein
MATKKKPAVNQKKLRAMNAKAVTVHMEGLIAAHAATAQDGRLEVATALAMTSDKITVDSTTDPFTTVPADAFDRTFDDNQIGINTADLVRLFIANLKSLLSGIASSLDQLPENPAMQIELVARFVRLALLQP